MLRRVVGRVLSVANRMPIIREQPRIATKVNSGAVPAPRGQVPTSAQSPWVCSPGSVSKRSTGSAAVAGRRTTTRRRRLAYDPVYPYPSASSRRSTVARRSGHAVRRRSTWASWAAVNSAGRAPGRYPGGSPAVTYFFTVRQLSPNSRARAAIDQPCRWSACSSIHVSSDCKSSLLSSVRCSAARA